MADRDPDDDIDDKEEERQRKVKMNNAKKNRFVFANQVSEFTKHIFKNIILAITSRTTTTRI